MQLFSQKETFGCHHSAFKIFGKTPTFNGIIQIMFKSEIMKFWEGYWYTSIKLGSEFWNGLCEAGMLYTNHDFLWVVKIMWQVNQVTHNCLSYQKFWYDGLWWSRVQWLESDVWFLGICSSMNCLFTITTKLNQIVSLFLLATVLQQKIVHSNIYIIVCCLYYTPQLQPADVYSIHCTVSIWLQISFRAIKFLNLTNFFMWWEFCEDYNSSNPNKFFFFFSLFQ